MNKLALSILLILFGFNASANLSNECVPAQLPQGDMPDFKQIQKSQGTRAMKGAFVKWIEPYAARIQQQTGLPSSVLISQAIEESGWGGSGLAKRGNNLFGIRCGGRTTFDFKADGTRYSSTGKCINGYATFESSQDGIYAYATKLLYQDPKGMDMYKNIRAVTAKAKAAGGAASAADVTKNIGEWYTGDNKPRNSDYRKYVKKISGHISDLNLTRIDNEPVCAGGGNDGDSSTTIEANNNSVGRGVAGN